MVGDEDNWFEINKITGDLRTVKVLDRESKFVKNNQYNISVVATDTGECHFLEEKHEYRMCLGQILVQTLLPLRF
jgi:hypothetical protein